MQKYEVLGVVGEGAYGVVIKCRNKENNEISTFLLHFLKFSPFFASQCKKTVAIKKFKDSDEDEVIRKNAQREIKALKFLKHDNIVELKEAFKRKGRIHLVFEYVERNLLEVLEKSPHGIEGEYLKNIIYQLVKAIDYCHSKEIVHRDIKPENLLVNKKSVLKLCDFGFARTLPAKTAKEIMTDYVATRWYRAPELLLSQSYGKPVDMWAIACIMAELIDGQPLFPGESEIDQLTLIQKIIDPLTADQKEAFNRHARFKGLRYKEVKKIDSLDKRYLGKISKRGMAFLKAILKMDPKERLTCKDALEHPYFEDLRALEKKDQREEVEKKINSDDLQDIALGGKTIREERATLDKQKREERKTDNSNTNNKENDLDRKQSFTESKLPIKVPSFISEAQFMHKSVYNYKIDEDKKLEEIFPYADQYTNKHENAKAMALKTNRKDPVLPPSLKNKNMATWIKNKNKKIQSIISNFNKETSNKATSYDSRLLNNDIFSDYVNAPNNITKQSFKNQLPILHKTHGRSEERNKYNQLGETSFKFDMSDNFMKIKNPFSNKDITNVKVPLKTDANNGKKLDSIKNIYNNTFNIPMGTSRGVFVPKEPPKKIK